MDHPSRTQPSCVALYARVSTDDQQDAQTIDSQVAELERFAQSVGWRVFGVYKDDGWSGSMLARPALDQLRDDAARGLFQAVLVNDVDRLARDLTHLGVLKRDLERNGVQVTFRKIPGENSPTQNLLVNVLGSFAEFERQLIADRTRRGRRHKVESRKQYLGCIPPYGFRYSPSDRASGREGHLEIDPEEATVVRQMYAWVDAEGLSGRKIVERLNASELRPRKGAQSWGRSTVFRILRSEVYAGTWHYNKFEACLPHRPTRTAKYQKTLKTSRRLRARTEWIPLQLPDRLTIVAPDLWERVQRQLDRNRAFSPRNSKHLYLLSGLVRCGACRATYVGSPCHGRYFYCCYRRCKRLPSVSEGRLDGTVWEAVKRAILRPEIITQGIESLELETAKAATAKERDAYELAQALEKVRHEEHRVLEAYRLGILSAAQLGAELDGLKPRLAALEDRRAAVQPVAWPIGKQQARRSIAAYCRLAARRLNHLTDAERQQFLRLLLREVVFEGTIVRIRGVIPVPPDEPNSALGNRALSRMIGPDRRRTSTATAAPGRCQIAPTMVCQHGRNTSEADRGFFGGEGPSEPPPSISFEFTTPLAPRPTRSFPNRAKRAA